MSAIFQLIGYLIIFSVVAFAGFISEDQRTYLYIIHIPSLVLVMIGLIGLSLLICHYKDLIELIKSIPKYSADVVKRKTQTADKEWEAMTAAYYSKDYIKLGQMASDKTLPVAWQVALSQLEAKMNPEDIKMLLERHAMNFEQSMGDQIKTLSQLSAMAPALGMFGTVLGLIKLLADLTDFDKVGANMSLALITTLYGIFFSNLILTPMVARFENYKIATMQCYERVYFWLNIIKENKPVFYLTQNFDKKK